MNMRYFYLILLLTTLSANISCKKQSEPTPEPPAPEGKYQQYGTPFANVPETEDIIMYEVNMRAFSPGGDLQGVIDRLDEISELSVNVIWLMPIHPIGEVNSVNSPYSVKDYKAVGSGYGTLEDLRALTDEAHARGIAVIMDWVANHTAWDNEWISNVDWYTQDNEGNIIHPPGTNWLDVADLNYDNEEMREAMFDAMNYWLYEANVDGFRCDYADGVPFDFWEQAWDSISTIPNRDFILFAEGSRRDHFAAGFNLNFGWELYGAMKGVFSGQSVSTLYTAINNEYSTTPAGRQWLHFTTNHDESAWDATPIALFNGVNGALAASVVTILIEGIPMIYTGQEVGTENNVPFFSNSPINWDNDPEMLQAYQEILQFYSGSDAARKGNMVTYPHTNIACFKRSFEGEEVLVLVNMRNIPLSFPVPETLQNTEWANALDNENIVLMDNLFLIPYEYLILTLVRK
jgi:glycosidase